MVESKPIPAEALANLHPNGRAHVLAGRSGTLEKRAAAKHSSQALCISVWGSIERRPKAARDAVVATIFDAAGLAAPPIEDVNIETEVRHHRYLLGEQRGGTPTSLDALLTWGGGVVSLESKFCEREFGHCGQVVWRAGAIVPGAGKCTGDHAIGSDNIATTQASNVACRLTVDDGRRRPARRYWELAPAAFMQKTLAAPRSPCPFAGGAYQLMRNVLFAHAYAAEEPPRRAWSGSLVCVADTGPVASELVLRARHFATLLRDEWQQRFGVIRYRQIARVVAEHGDVDLANWIELRLIEGAASAASKSPSKQSKLG